MANKLPLVLEGIDLLGFIQYVLSKHTGPSTLLVCTTKDVFLHQMHSALQGPNGNENLSSSVPDTATSKQAWQTPTLRLLASSKDVRVIFCPDLPHLRAFLATCGYSPTQSSEFYQVGNDPPTSLLAILNIIDIHRTTSAFSAQGINRTIAAAVEAAFRCRNQLLLAQCAGLKAQELPEDSILHEQPDPSIADERDKAPWDEAVSILNVTTKSFGAGERGWVGRTVSLRRIAGRWCRFENFGSAIC